jgi:hypothetical protein
LIYRVLHIAYTFYGAAGDSITSEVMGEGMDSGDKAANKAMAVAHKYAIMQLLSIPTEDAKDPERDSPEVAPRITAFQTQGNAPTSAPAPKTPKAPAQPAMSDKQRQELGLITSQQVVALIAAIKTAGIKQPMWVSWLSASYGVLSVAAIRAEMYAGILECVTKTPERIVRVAENEQDTKSFQQVADEARYQ